MKEFFEFYKADETGRIFSTWFGEKRKMKLTLKPNGYLKFNATLKSGQKRTFNAHMFIWKFFNGEIPAGLEIHHIDHDKTNNRLSNLKLVTRTENMLYALLADRPVGKGDKKGSRNGRSKLSEKQVKEIYFSKMTAKELHTKYKIGLTAIYDIKLKRKWGHLWE